MRFVTLSHDAQKTYLTNTRPQFLGSDDFEEAGARCRALAVISIA
jgi:hypothetical protein